MLRKFTHFTNSKKSLLNILKYGFAWMRNDRVVIQSLLPDVDFSEREPQSFGQICFTENTFETNKDHTKFFGSYGIQVSLKWAEEHNIQPVIYIPDNGPILESFRFLFQQTFQKAQAEELFPNDTARQKWIVSSAMAGVTGKPVYKRLLDLYQFMEPAQYSAEREWRIVNPNTDWSIPHDRKTTIKNISPPKGWGNVLYTLPIRSDDIVAFVCHEKDKNDLFSSLSEEFKGISIFSY